MGLDMYLERMPRYKDATASDVMAVASYLDWQKCKAEGSEYANCSFKEWCGRDEIPSNEYIDFYSTFYKAYYSDWDTEHQHPWMRIHEEVGYWRKANHIHRWFVDTIQDGEDDCCYHREVDEDDIRELLDLCEVVLASCELVDGQVFSGYRYDENNTRIPIMDSGKTVEDSCAAEMLLPTQSGFFFGGTDYDEWYVEDIKHTIEIIKNVLETTDFETQMLYYVSSW